MTARSVLPEVLSLRYRLAEAMGAKGWDQKTLGKESKVAPSTISKILGGKRPNVPLDTVLKLADALGVSRQWLIEGNVRTLRRTKRVSN